MRFLILFPKYYWSHKMSGGRRDVVRWLLDSTRSTLSGPGWTNWGESATLEQNISRIMPDAEAILWYKPLGNERNGVPPVIESHRHSIPTVEVFNEAWWPERRAYNECMQAGTDLVIHHHLSDAKQFAGIPAVHIPHCANQHVFTRHAREWEDRDISLLVVGALDKEIYPLRTRVAEMIKSGAFPGAWVRKHPGYRLPDLEACDWQQDDYARELGRAKLVLCCASKYNYGLAKTVEAAQAGACVIGDVPPDFEFTLGPHMMSLDNAWSDNDLRRAINAYIKSNPWPFANGGQDVAVRHHGIDVYCHRLISAVEGFIAARSVAA